MGECLASSCDVCFLITRLRGGRLHRAEKEVAGLSSKRATLIHLSDERRDPSEYPLVRGEYKNWARVFRNYFDSEYSDMPNVQWFPLGYSSNGFDWSQVQTDIPASKRRHDASFMGNDFTNKRRAGMIRNFEEQSKLVVTGAVRRGGWGSGGRNEYVRLMMDSKFCLALPGTSLESFRLYEALQAGCIPVMLDQWTDGKQWNNFSDGERPYLSSVEQVQLNSADELQNWMNDSWHEVKKRYRGMMQPPI